MIRITSYNVCYTKLLRFGKGTVQELKPLGDGRLKITSAKFYRVSGKSTQHKGVEPDIWFPPIYRTKDTGESALDGALLWDHIDATRYSAYMSLQPMIQSLDDAYKKRAEKSFGIKYLTQRIQLAESLSEQKNLSLNLARITSYNVCYTKLLRLRNKLNHRFSNQPGP